MEIPDEQIQEFKKQIIQQISSTFPEDKKDYAIESVNSMNKQEFLEFLKKNNLINSSESSEQDSKEIASGESPFRLIIEGKIPSYIVDENKDSLAVLEIRPASKAHIIIIPKKPISDPKKLPKSLFLLAKKISKKIQENFKPKDILVSPSSALGEIILNILPVYSNETLSSQRNQISKEELEDLKNTLEKKKKNKIIQQPKIKKIESSKIWLPKRIP